MGVELSSPVGRGRGYPPHAAAGHLRRLHALPDREEWTRNTLDLGPPLQSPQRLPPLKPKPNERGAQEAPLQTSSSFDWKITVSDAFSPDQATRDWFAIASSIWSADELHLRLVGPLPDSSWHWMCLEDGPLASWDHRASEPSQLYTQQWPDRWVPVGRE